MGVCLHILGVGKSANFDSTIGVSEAVSHTMFGKVFDKLEHHSQLHDQHAPHLSASILLYTDESVLLSKAIRVATLA